MFRARSSAPLRRALPLVALVAGFVLAAPAAAQSDPPAAPAIEAVHPGNEALTVVWEAPSGVSNITAYDVRYVLTSADETDDSNWTVEEDAWTGGALHHVLIGLTDDAGYDVQVRGRDRHGRRLVGYRRRNAGRPGIARHGPRPAAGRSARRDHQPFP